MTVSLFVQFYFRETDPDRKTKLIKTVKKAKELNLQMYTYSEKSMIMFVITLFVAFKICFKQLSSESAYERNLKMDKKIIYVKLIKGCDPIDHFEQTF